MGDWQELVKEADDQNLLNEILEEQEQQKYVNLQDRTKEGTFFQTVFFIHEGKYKPFVITQDKTLIPVKSNEEELRKEGINKKDIKQKEKYHYFEHNGTQYRYNLEYLGFNPAYNINHPSKVVLKWIATKKKLTTQVYEEIKQQVKDYWDFDQEPEYNIQTADVIESYISRAIGGTIYHIFNGVENTGKSTIQRIKTRLQFNAKFSGLNTVAVTSRLQHLYSIVINQDEFEKISPEAKKIFIGCANTGFYPDGTYEYTDINKKEIHEQITILRTFGKRSFSSNSLYGFDKSFISRCHVVTCTRQYRKLKDSNNLRTEEREKFQELTDKAFLYTLENVDKIIESIKETKEEHENSGEFGRDTDKNSIILGIIKHFTDDKTVQETKEYLQNLAGLEEKTVNSNTTDALIMECVAKKFTEQTTTVTIENKEIVSYIADQKDLDDKEQKRLSRSIGHLIKKLKLVNRETQVIHSNKGRKYEIDYSDILNSVNRFGFNELKKTLTQNPPSLTSLTSLTSQKSEESEESEISEAGFRNDILSKFSSDIPKKATHIYQENPDYTLQQIQERVEKALTEGDLMQVGHNGGETEYLRVEKEDITE